MGTLSQTKNLKLVNTRTGTREVFRLGPWRFEGAEKEAEDSAIVIDILCI
jgi:hypothetical protein